jgi:hypothetical protein
MPRKPTSRKPASPKPTSPNPRARNVKPKAHDPYRHRLKTEDALVCKECGVVYHDGRWYWGAPPLCDEKSCVCPACQRVRDRYPAGTIRLHGLPSKYRDEILRMIRNTEEREKQEHPLERLIDIEDEADDLVVTTTGTHLGRCIAGDLRRRFHRGVTVRYPEEENLIQVDWVLSESG